MKKKESKREKNNTKEKKESRREKNNTKDLTWFSQYRPTSTK